MWVSCIRWPCLVAGLALIVLGCSTSTTSVPVEPGTTPVLTTLERSQDSGSSNRTPTFVPTPTGKPKLQATVSAAITAVPTETTTPTNQPSVVSTPTVAATPTVIISVNRPREPITTSTPTVALPTSTSTPSPSPTPVPEPTQTAGPRFTPTLAPTPSPTPTPIPTPDSSPPPSPTPTSPPATSTPEPSPTPTPVPTATPMPTPTPTLPPTPTPAPTATSAPIATAVPPPSPTPTSIPVPDLRIDCILFDGKVRRAESDEYVQITNHGTGGQQLLGWVLRDRDDEHQDFRFPSYLLPAGLTIRVYTDEVHEEWGGFSFDRGSSVWNNGEADTAVLIDELGRIVSEKSYDTEFPPGCLS